MTENPSCSQEDKLEAIKFFIEKTNANYSGTTFYHGISDLLNGIIPDFFLDNLNSYKIGDFIKKGFVVKHE